MLFIFLLFQTFNTIWSLHQSCADLDKKRSSQLAAEERDSGLIEERDSGLVEDFNESETNKEKAVSCNRELPANTAYWK